MWESQNLVRGCEWVIAVPKRRENLELEGERTTIKQPMCIDQMPQSGQSSIHGNNEEGIVAKTKCRLENFNHTLRCGCGQYELGLENLIKIRRA
jgi:hypothetical protein